MKALFILTAFILCLSSISGEEKYFPAGTAPIVADYRAVESFNQIPVTVLSLLSSYRLAFRHASVGTTIDNALDCLQGTRTNPVECTTYTDYKFDRRKWVFQGRPNSGWFGKINDFVTEVNVQKNNFDILTFKFCYLDGLDGLQEPCGSNFSQQKMKQAWDYYRINMDSLEKANPSKFFVWITIPLTQVGQFCTDTLNSLIRSYCRQQGKILFDIADIQCHDNAGVLQKSAKGWQVAYKPFCGEQQAGAQACHPNWDGGIRIAKAFWWMMYQVHSSLTDTFFPHEFGSDPDVRIFPNPATHILHIDLQRNYPGFSHYEICSVSGEKMYHKVIQPDEIIELKVDFLTPGVYFLRFTGESGISRIKKIVITN